jgi:hypothetical protein
MPYRTSYLPQYEKDSGMRTPLPSMLADALRGIDRKCCNLPDRLTMRLLGRNSFNKWI